MELAATADSFRKRGLGVAAVIPEPVETLKAFATAHGVSYPLLSDAQATIIRRFGLLDPGFKGTGAGSGVPYAGNFLVDAKGIVQAKFFEQSTENRRTAGSILALQGEPGTGGEEIRAAYFTLRTASSNAEVAPGQRFTLALDFDMKPKHHAYAPGVRGYRPLMLRLDPDPSFEFHETQFPVPRSYFFAPLKETVPVFEGRFRVTQDVTLVMRGALSRLKESPVVPVTIMGSLDYQVCSDRVCYPPTSSPVRWSITIRPWVRKAPQPKAS